MPQPHRHDPPRDPWKITLALAACMAFQMTSFVMILPLFAGRLGGLVGLASRIPRFARLLYYRGLKLSPHWVKQVQGTAIVTSVGMFGKRAGWGIAFLMSHTLGLTVGGIGERPVVHEGAVVPRECLNLTLSFDHDIVDGAPAARFARTLVEIIESGSALDSA